MPAELERTPTIGRTEPERMRMPNQPSMNLPRINFICAGTQKGGTTTLNAYLRGHHQIDFPRHELHFFDNESQNWNHPNIDWYHNHFPTLGSPSGVRRDGTAASQTYTICGEATPIYMYWKPSLGRIYAYNPEIRLIFLLRNPMARAYSHWAMEINRGDDSLSFSECIRTEPLRCKQAHPLQHRVYSYLDRGRYYLQLRRILSIFPRQQLLVLCSEHFFAEPMKALDQISDFLEIEPFLTDRQEHERLGRYPMALSLEDWQYMYSHFSDDISRLEDLLGWDCTCWRNPWPGIRS